MVIDQMFKCSIRVYIEDTDAGGIVYYVNYLKFMERARTEFLRSLGFDKTFIFNSERMFVVKELKSRYLAPAVLDDDLVVTVRVVELGGANMVMEQNIYRDSEPLCEGEVQIVCVDKASLKPRRIPEEILSTLRNARGYN